MTLLVTTFATLILAQYGISSSISPLDDPDVGLNTVQMIESHGYPCEIHTITTEDGYILTYHRIPHGKNTTEVNTKPVLLMHGASCSSADFVNMGPDRSLGYILADKGYDVWIGNARGTAWSRNHTTLDVVTDAGKFYDFSWHEMGYYDLPAAIDHILDASGVESLHYVGHSIGTTAFLVFATTRPEYNSKIKLASLLAPISSMEHQTNLMLSVVAKYIDKIEALAQKYKIYEIPLVAQIRTFGVQFCSQPAFFSLCENILFAIVEMYGTETPPNYDISKISAPVALYYGKNDAVVNPEDVAQLTNELPNVANDRLIPYELFNHFDFLIAVDVVELLYTDLVDLMDMY